MTEPNPARLRSAVSPAARCSSADSPLPAPGAEPAVAPGAEPAVAPIEQDFAALCPACRRVCSRSRPALLHPVDSSAHGRHGFARRVVRLTGPCPFVRARRQYAHRVATARVARWARPIRLPPAPCRVRAGGTTVYARVRKSAAWAPMNILGAWVCPRTSTGIIEASATRRPRTPRTRSCGSTTLFSSEPIRQVPAGW